MNYFKVDGRISSSPGAVKAGVPAMGAWVIMGSWVSQYDAGGFIPRFVAEAMLGPDAGEWGKRLVDAGLWADSSGEPGWYFINWRQSQLRDYRPRISAALRHAVYERDGWACLHCGAEDRLSLDHIHPYSKGGEDSYENLQTLCSSCNSKKGAS